MEAGLTRIPHPHPCAFRAPPLSAQPHMQPTANGRNVALLSVSLLFCPATSFLHHLDLCSYPHFVLPLQGALQSAQTLASRRLSWKHASGGGTPIPRSPSQPRALRMKSECISLAFKVPWSWLSFPLLPLQPPHTSAPPVRQNRWAHHSIHILPLQIPFPLPICPSLIYFSW